MAFAPIPEYEGKSPYVFISYAQQDERIAYSIAVKMYNEGFRLWSSAACGNPSSMRIAERLSNSAVAMVFLSKSYLKFASSREFEPRAVMNSPKQKIVILLDDTPMGTDWNAVDFPAGIRYNPDVPQGLWLRINSSDALEKCRGA
ncbi:MAG: toll/interleukin-1 receptor domain-containing protein, partial [Clostridia bacterium]|nr:toll/interleukin-1 receptor domain-containing protein [Clostridia bacterium]